MFLCHYAVGLAAKKWVPKVSLGTLFLASVWLDLLWAVFLFLGWESVKIMPGVTKVLPIEFTDYSLSHSLVLACAWACLFGLVSLIITGKEKTSLILAGLVLSNWVLNLLFHHSDMTLLPLTEGSELRLGLGLWNSVAGTIVVESILFALGVWIYLTATRAEDAAGQWSFWALCGCLTIFFIGLFLLPAPKNVGWVSVAGQIQLLFVAWGYWLDDHRKSV